VSGWRPIETAPVEPFDAASWYMNASPSVLVWQGSYCVIATYGYTKQGKGRWRDHRGNIEPTHWMPLPAPPERSRQSLKGDDDEG
jgi:hypothetical protein